jgi:hypothetical protein
VAREPQLLRSRATPGHGSVQGCLSEFGQVESTDGRGKRIFDPESMEASIQELSKHEIEGRSDAQSLLKHGSKDDPTRMHQDLCEKVGCSPSHSA